MAVAAAGALAPAMLVLQGQSRPRAVTPSILFYVPVLKVQPPLPEFAPLRPARASIRGRKFGLPLAAVPNSLEAPELPAPAPLPTAAGGFAPRFEVPAVIGPVRISAWRKRTARTDVPGEITVFRGEVCFGEDRMIVAKVERHGNRLELYGNATASRMHLRAAWGDVREALAGVEPATGLRKNAARWTVSAE